MPPSCQVFDYSVYLNFEVLQCYNGVTLEFFHDITAIEAFASTPDATKGWKQE